ncbi:MAG TPA: Type 1 glutamine amidotransferase-like domain-containing protein [Microlunatus sp.]
MSVHLVGGGRDLAVAASVYGGFLAQAGRRALSSGRTVPRIGVVLVADRDDLADGVDWFRQALARCGPADGVCVDPVAAEVVSVTAELEGDLSLEDRSVPTALWWAGLDGLLVGGGLTPAYHRALLPHAVGIRDAVAGGLPYAGFSAGAMIAPQQALLGGWRLGLTAVTHEDNAEDLDQVTVVEGLGLISTSVEVHTTQWGTLSRLIATVAAGMVSSGIAVDENTVVILDPATDGGSTNSGAAGPVDVVGTGQAWLLTADDGAVRVDRREPGRFR